MLKLIAIYFGRASGIERATHELRKDKADRA